MQIATKTLEAINNALEADDGARFRGLFRDALPEISDAFNDVPDTMPRTHLGGSLIGGECARAALDAGQDGVVDRVAANVDTGVGHGQIGRAHV